MSATLAFLGLGGNLGEPLSLFDQLIEEFRLHPKVSEVRESPRYRSEPIDATGPDFVNSVLQLLWHGSADELLNFCMNTEHAHGRVRSTRNAPRLIDVDILLFGNHIIDSENLTVPHPRMHLRRFVLEPLLQLQPELTIPGRGLASDLLRCTLSQRLTQI